MMCKTKNGFLRHAHRNLSSDRILESAITVSQNNKQKIRFDHASPSLF